MAEEQVISDIRFKQFSNLLIPQIDASSISSCYLNRSYNYLACSSHYGVLLFSALHFNKFSLGIAFSSQLTPLLNLVGESCTTDSFSSVPNHIKYVDLPQAIHSLHLIACDENSNQEILVIIFQDQKTIRLYDVAVFFSFLDSDASSPVSHLTEIVLDKEKSISSFSAYLYTDNLLIYSLLENNFLMKLNYSLNDRHFEKKTTIIPKILEATCVVLCQKGTKLLIGTYLGNILDMNLSEDQPKLAEDIPCQTLGLAPIKQMLAISFDTLLLVTEPSLPDNRLFFYNIQDKDIIQFEDPTFACRTTNQSILHIPHYYSLNVKPINTAIKDIVLIAASTSTDIALLGRRMDQQNWSVWLLARDEYMATFPINEEASAVDIDTYPTGIAVDYSNVRSIPAITGDIADPPLPPAPLIWGLASNGVLVCYQMVNLAFDLGISVTFPPKKLSSNISNISRKMLQQNDSENLNSLFTQNGTSSLVASLSPPGVPPSLPITSNESKFNTKNNAVEENVFLQPQLEEDNISSIEFDYWDKSGPLYSLLASFDREVQSIKSLNKSLSGSIESFRQSKFNPVLSLPATNTQECKTITSFRSRLASLIDTLLAVSQLQDAVVYIVEKGNNIDWNHSKKLNWLKSRGPAAFEPCTFLRISDLKVQRKLQKDLKNIEEGVKHLDKFLSLFSDASNKACQNNISTNISNKISSESTDLVRLLHGMNVIDDDIGDIQCRLNDISLKKEKILNRLARRNLLKSRSYGLPLDICVFNREDDLVLSNSPREDQFSQKTNILWERLTYGNLSNLVSSSIPSLNQQTDTESDLLNNTACIPTQWLLLSKRRMAVLGSSKYSNICSTQIHRIDPIEKFADLRSYKVKSTISSSLNKSMRPLDDSPKKDLSLLTLKSVQQQTHITSGITRPFSNGVEDIITNSSNMSSAESRVSHLAQEKTASNSIKRPDSFPFPGSSLPNALSFLDKALQNPSNALNATEFISSASPTKDSLFSGHNDISQISLDRVPKNPSDISIPAVNSPLFNKANSITDSATLNSNTMVSSPFNTTLLAGESTDSNSGHMNMMSLIESIDGTKPVPVLKTYIPQDHSKISSFDAIKSVHYVSGDQSENTREPKSTALSVQNSAIPSKPIIDITQSSKSPGFDIFGSSTLTPKKSTLELSSSETLPSSGFSFFNAGKPEVSFTESSSNAKSFFSSVFSPSLAQKSAPEEIRMLDKFFEHPPLPSLSNEPKPSITGEKIITSPFNQFSANVSSNSSIPPAVGPTFVGENSVFGQSSIFGGNIPSQHTFGSSSFGESISQGGFGGPNQFGTFGKVSSIGSGPSSPASTGNYPSSGGFASFANQSTQRSSDNSFTNFSILAQSRINASSLNDSNSLDSFVSKSLSSSNNINAPKNLGNAFMQYRE